MLTERAFAVVGRGSLWRTLATACMFFTLLLAVAWPMPARATTLERMSIEQLSRRATTIVEGTVVSTAFVRSSDGVRTAVRIRVKDSLKGAASSVQTVYVPGGVLPDGTQVVVDGMASFSPGQSCYVFVDKRGWVMAGFQGKLDVVRGRVTGSGETIATMSRRVRAALGRAGPVAGKPGSRQTPAPPPAGASTAVSTGAAGWFKQTSGSTAYLYDVAFTDSAHGWAVGSDPSAWPGEVSTILATTNGGATWSKQTSGNSDGLQAVAFTDGAHGWAVGGHGIILATTNGGATWSAQRQSSPEAEALWSVAFSDVNHGLAVGMWCPIFTTTDGGATWHDQGAGYGQTLNGVAFPDSSHGWAVGNTGTILATTDGGVTWSPQSSGTTSTLTDVAFADSTHGWAVGGGIILGTANGGATWSVENSGGATDLWGVDFNDSSHGWAAGNNQHGTGAILATTNGGATWSAQSTGNSNSLWGVDFSDASHGWAVGDNGTILATMNGGWPPAPGSPTISSISPGQASAGTNTHVTITGTDFGSTRGKVEFSYGRKNVMRISAGDIASWTDTSINCAVPTATIAAYDASAGSGPVVVTTSTGKESNPYDFVVPFGYGGSKWASPGLTYLVNTSGIDDALRENLVDTGTARWNGAGSAFRFTDGGTTTAEAANDGLNVLSWTDDLPAGVIARATSYINGGIVSQCDVQFNNAYSWADGTPGSNTVDTQSTTMHEVGHWLRLLDQYMPGDAAKVMYGYGGKNVQKRTLAAGDIAGIRWIYPDAGPAPTVTSFLPASGPVGTSVTITGTNFAGATKVAFHGTTAVFSVNSATRITAKVPAAATTGTIAVTTPGGSATSATSFTVTAPAPTITLKLSGLTSGAVKLGRRVTAKGTVTPTGLAGSKVKLSVQRKKGGKWVKAKTASAVIAAGGAYSWKYKPTRKGAYRIKATLAKTTAHAAARTPWRKFKVK